MKKMLAVFVATSVALVSGPFARKLDRDKTHDLRLYHADGNGTPSVALEQGSQFDKGQFVTLGSQFNSRVRLDAVIDGQLDGAQMLAGQPRAATIGDGSEAPMATPVSMDLNGNGITVSVQIREMMKPNIPTMDHGRPQHPIPASALQPVIDTFISKGKPFCMGMVFTVSINNHELFHWLADDGVEPA